MVLFEHTPTSRDDESSASNHRVDRRVLPTVLAKSNQSLNIDVRELRWPLHRGH
jgi:hypothetical protein